MDMTQEYKLYNEMCDICDWLERNVVEDIIEHCTCHTCVKKEKCYTARRSAIFYCTPGSTAYYLEKHINCINYAVNK